MKRAAYLGLDIGGTGAKAGVYDSNGDLLGLGRVSLAPMTNSGGHTEISIEEVYTAARDAVRRAAAESGASIRAMAISSQGQTFVSLDAEGQPLHRAILWYDSRAEAQADKLREAILASKPADPMLYVEAIAAIPKVLWLREHHPEIMSRAQRYLLLPDYISHRLTGEAVTDPSTAASTGLYADDAPDYSPEALAAANIEHNCLAAIRQPGSAISRIGPEMAREWGLENDTLLVVGTNDQYAGALGAGNCRPRIVSETTGTCLALVTLTQKLPYPMPPGLFGGRFPIPKYQFALAYSKTAGVVIDWFRDRFRPDLSLNELDSMAAGVPAGSGGITVLPHFDGAVSPYPNQNARGLIHGLTLATSTEHIYRAILESISFSLRENLEFIRENGLIIDVLRSIGGAAKSDFWLQMKADVTNLPVERPKHTEAATLGAAMLAAVGARDFASVEECSESLVTIDRVFEPDPDQVRLYEEPYTAYQKLCKQVY